MPLLPVPDPVAVGLDVVGWAAIHAGTGYWAHRLRPERLAADRGILRSRRFEDDGRLYERVRIRRWKDRVPEAGALFAGGISKRHIASGRAGLDLYAREARRAELGHWAAIALSPLLLLWNPPVASAILLAYGLAVNLPCIAIQRYNRARIARSSRWRTPRASEVRAGPSRRSRRSGRSMP